MKRFVCLAVALALALLPAAAAAGGEERRLECPEGRPGCWLLQMAMAGSFEDFDPEDALSVRVLSAVYPRLCEVTTDDVAHCAAELGEEEAAVREQFFRALRACLWADILAETAPGAEGSAARRVLLLFIDPSSQEDAEYQMAQIRAAMTDEALEALAAGVGASAGFVRWLVDEGGQPAEPEDGQPAGTGNGGDARP